MSRGIDGTFFEIHHHNTAEGKYWNPALDSFTAENWREKVREIAALKMEYIVVMATALYDRCYFESSVFPLADIPCADPIEAVPVGGGDRSFKAMDELTEKYALHKSFYGWYFPDETCIILRFSDNFTKYVNLCSARCREITPDKKTLIAPYGTNLTLTNSKYIYALASPMRTR